jgi:undecaprenyl-diphosphatase
MTEARLTLLWRQVDGLEVDMCRRCSRVGRYAVARSLFAGVSRLGDGVFWYGLMAVLPLIYGDAGRAVSLLMLACGAVSLAIYKGLKHRLVRERPYVWHPELDCGTPPLDRFSFPSGHTLHAVCFTTVALAGFPELGWLLLPFTALVAASRVVLGLHYPTDVLAGAAIGYAVGQAGLTLAG